MDVKLTPTSLIIDGKDIAVAVKAVDFRIRPNQQPSLVVELWSPVEFDGEGVVRVDERHAAALVALGWTPPPTIQWAYRKDEAMGFYGPTTEDHARTAVTEDPTGTLYHRILVPGIQPTAADWIKVGLEAPAVAAPKSFGEFVAGLPVAEPKPKPCPRCEGCGQLANSDDREPWTAWTSLPYESQIAVRLGLVRPIPCDACAGTGQAKAAEEQA